MMKFSIALFALFLTSSSLADDSTIKLNMHHQHHRDLTRCSEYEVLDGTCVDACSCPCGDGLGVLVMSVPDEDCDEPKQVCSDPVLAYDLTTKGKATCVMTCPADEDDCDDKEEVEKKPEEPEFKTCSQKDFLSGTCPEACGCPCYSSTHGPGYLLETLPSEDCDDEPERLCMGKLFAYQFVVHSRDMKCATACEKDDVIADDKPDNKDVESKDKKTPKQSSKSQKSTKHSSKSKESDKTPKQKKEYDGKSKKTPKESNKTPKEKKDYGPKPPSFKTCTEHEIRTKSCPDICQCSCYNDNMEGVWVASSTDDYGRPLQMVCMDEVDAYEHTSISQDMVCLEKCPDDEPITNDKPKDDGKEPKSGKGSKTPKNSGKEGKGKAPKSGYPSDKEPTPSGKEGKGKEPKSGDSGKEGKGKASKSGYPGDKSDKEPKEGTPKSGDKSKTPKSGKEPKEGTPKTGDKSKTPKSGKEPKEGTPKSSDKSKTPKSGKEPQEGTPKFEVCSEESIRSRTCPELCKCPCYNDMDEVYVVGDDGQPTCMDSLEAYKHTIITQDMVCVDSNKCPSEPKPIEPVPEPQPEPSEPKAPEPVCEKSDMMTIDFDTDGQGNPTSASDLAADMYSNLGITISTNNPSKPAMLFDTKNPTGGDNDLFHETEGMVLIISEDGDASDPDDNARGGSIFLEFATPVCYMGMGMFDIEEEGDIFFFDASGSLMKQQVLPTMKDGEMRHVELGLCGVSKVEITMTGSGAFTDMELCAANLKIPDSPGGEPAPPKALPPPTPAPTGSPTSTPSTWLSEQEQSQGCETAFAYDAETGTCFTAYDINRWGWSIGVTPSNSAYNFEIYAGAAHCDPTKGTKVGDLEFSWNGDSGYVTYIAGDYYKFEETHFYIGWNPLPKDDNGNDTVAPGQYSVVHDVCENSQYDHITFSGVTPNPDGKIYIIAHAVSCDDW